VVTPVQACRNQHRRIGHCPLEINSTMLNSRPESLDNRVPIGIFNRWPTDRDAVFSLLARGGLVISSARKGGMILLEVQSSLGGECRLASPWRNGGVTLHRSTGRTRAIG
jgi:hypothetical protein